MGVLGVRTAGRRSLPRSAPFCVSFQSHWMACGAGFGAPLKKTGGVAHGSGTSAEAFSTLFRLGVSHVEVGSVTPEPMPLLGTLHLLPIALQFNILNDVAPRDSVQGIFNFDPISLVKHFPEAQKCPPPPMHRR